MGQRASCVSCCAHDENDFVIRAVRQKRTGESTDRGIFVDLDGHDVAGCAVTCEDDDDEDDYNSNDYFEREAMELQWVKQVGRVDGKGRHMFQSGATYDGEWFESMRNGFGQMTWPDGASYIGEWHENRANGRGVFLHSDGDEYVGQWDSNMASGLGVLYHNGRVSYSGYWRKDLQHGVGIEVVDDNGRYEGEFRDGQKQGFGCYTWADGSTYYGVWFDNAINGHGCYASTDGRVFNGTWRDAEIHGMGRYTWPDGNEYNGSYAADHKEGFGIFKWNDGRVFKGFWSNGKQHGHGLYSTKEGRFGAAMWKDGQKVTESGVHPGVEVRAPNIVSELATASKCGSALEDAAEAVANMALASVAPLPEDPDDDDSIIEGTIVAHHELDETGDAVAGDAAGVRTADTAKESSAVFGAAAPDAGSARTPASFEMAAMPKAVIVRSTPIAQKPSAVSPVPHGHGSGLSSESDQESPRGPE